jgi:hypothetical protein
VRVLIFAPFDVLNKHTIPYLNLSLRASSKARVSYTISCTFSMIAGVWQIKSLEEDLIDARSYVADWQ